MIQLNHRSHKMLTRIVSALAFLVVLATSSNLQAAERLAVLPVSAINVHPAYQQIAQDLLKDNLAQTGKYEVVEVPGTGGTNDATPEQAAEAGRAAGADLVLLSHLTHLQSTFRVRITVFRVSTRQMVHADSLSTSGGPDQLDPVLSRLVQAFAKGERAGSNAEIDTVTQGEGEAYVKQAANKSFGLRLGAILPLNRARGSIGAGPGLGIYWLYDAREYMAEVFLDFYSSTGSGGADGVTAFDVGLGLYRPFSRKNVVPYAGGGVAYSVSSFGGAGANGLRLHGAFGVLFGRLSTVQLRAEVGYFVNAYQEAAYHDYDLLAGQSNSKALSHGPMLMVGIGF
jgi:hypothetical protein